MFDDSPLQPYQKGQAHERSNAPIVEWKHGKIREAFLSAVSRLVLK